MIGTVTHLQYMKNRKQRRYGFIHGTNNQDYWFSLVGISEGTLSVGMTVSFEGERNEKGNVAVSVKPMPGNVVPDSSRSKPVINT